MSALVELIQEWETFSRELPGGKVSDFCRYYLKSQHDSPKNPDLFRGMAPPDLFTTLAKLVVRIGAIHSAYSKIALKEMTEAMDVEWFHFMNAIYHQKEVRKSDVINFNFYEQSTGTDILTRIKNAGYLLERDDPSDKRAKLISLSPKGENVLMKAYALMHLPGLIMFHELDENEKELLVSLLGSIEVKHTMLLPEYKNKGIHELCDDHLGKDGMKRTYLKIQRMVDDFKKQKSNPKSSIRKKE